MFGPNFKKQKRKKWLEEHVEAKCTVIFLLLSALNPVLEM